MKKLLILVILLAACKRETNVNQGNVDRGRQLVNQYGCGTCHSIPGVPGASGMVGPALDHIAQRPALAGKYPNTPDFMARWLQNPQAIDPHNTMPNLGVTPDDARDLTAFLFTLK